MRERTANSEAARFRLAAAAILRLCERGCPFGNGEPKNARTVPRFRRGSRFPNSLWRCAADWRSSDCNGFAGDSIPNVKKSAELPDGLAFLT
jgi:hypothetical protein